MPLPPSAHVLHHDLLPRLRVREVVQRLVRLDERRAPNDLDRGGLGIQGGERRGAGGSGYVGEEAKGPGAAAGYTPDEGLFRGQGSW